MPIQQLPVFVDTLSVILTNVSIVDANSATILVMSVENALNFESFTKNTTLAGIAVYGVSKSEESKLLTVLPRAERILLIYGTAQKAQTLIQIFCNTTISGYPISLFTKDERDPKYKLVSN